MLIFASFMFYQYRKWFILISSSTDNSTTKENKEIIERANTSSSSSSTSSCESIVREWISTQESRFKSRRKPSGEEKPLTFFLHIPRTAGRTINFCFLKHATPEKERCARAYDELRTDLKDPKCSFLASHDDYSIVERMATQPKIVTMVREVYSRTLSAYEFSVEVAMRSGGKPTKSARNNPNPSKTSTRDVWPWGHLVRHIDEDIINYRRELDAKRIEKAVISDPYDNPVYTSLDAFLEIPMAKEDLHNAQFFQILGLTNNTFTEYEPNAGKLRECARVEGSKASELLFTFAKKRLRREIDALLIHEQLDKSIELAAAMLNTPIDGISHYQSGKQNLEKIMQDILQRPAIDDDHIFPHRASVPMYGPRRAGGNGDSLGASANDDDKLSPMHHGTIGVIFVFQLKKIINMEDDDWREEYIENLKRAVAKFLLVSPSDIEVDPFAFFPNFHPKTWDETPSGRHLISIKKIDNRFSAERIIERLLKVRELVNQRDSKTYNAFKELLEKYGPDMAISYIATNVGGKFSRRDDLGAVETDKNNNLKANRGRTLGMTFRECEKFQGGRYKKQQNRAFDKLHELVENDKGFLFSKESRNIVKPETVARISELNHLDVRLYAEAKIMMEANLVKYAKELKRQGELPPSLLTTSFSGKDS